MWFFDDFMHLFLGTRQTSQELVDEAYTEGKKVLLRGLISAVLTFFVIRFLWKRFF